MHFRHFALLRSPCYLQMITILLVRLQRATMLQNILLYFKALCHDWKPLARTFYGHFLLVRRGGKLVFKADDFPASSLSFLSSLVFSRSKPETVTINWVDQWFYSPFALQWLQSVIKLDRNLALIVFSSITHSIGRLMTAPLVDRLGKTHIFSLSYLFILRSYPSKP